MRGSRAPMAGYFFFNLGSARCAALVMLPATFCAGTTLPLITAASCAAARRGAHRRGLCRKHVGAIVGVVAAVHVGLPLLGLEGRLVAGAALDIALGLVLLVAAALLARAGVGRGGGPRASCFACSSTRTR